MKPNVKTSLLKLLAVGAVFYGTYGLTNRLTEQRGGVPEIVFGWERDIPFLAWTIVPYWSLNLMYAAAFFLCRSVREQNRYTARLLLAQAVATVCFLLFPLQFGWPKPETDGISGWLFDSLAAFDRPYNQAPSLHIILTLVVGSFYWHRFPNIRLPLALWLLLIAASVLTTFQHHFIDIPTGALAGCLVLWLLPPVSGRHPAGRHRADAGCRRLAKRYLAGAAVCAGGACSGGAWLWLLWPAVSLLLVAYAYIRGGAAVFQKRADGRHSFAAAALMLPYTLGVRLNMAFWLRGKAKSAAVRDGVFVGSVTAEAGFASAVDVCAEYACLKPPADYVCIPMLDLAAPAAADLAEAARELERLRREHGETLVCCALGYGRSAAVVLVWLLVYGGCTDLAEAVGRLKAVRPQAVLPAATEAGVLEAVRRLRMPV